LVWTQAPFGYGCSLIIGGLFFAKKMREQVVDSELTALKQLFTSRFTEHFFSFALKNYFVIF